MKESLRPRTIHHHHQTIQDYLRVVLKRRWSSCTILFMIIATVAFYTFTAIPIYKATVQILIERHAPKLLDRETTQTFDYGSEEFFQTQYQLLESPALAKKVVDKLGLQNHPHFAPMFKKLPPNADNSARQKVEEDLIRAVKAGIQVSPIKQSSLVNVSFSDPDPKFATTIVNTLAQCYIEYSLDLRFAASQEESTWLKQKMGEARKKLEDSESKLNQYKREYNIVSTDDKESITAQKLEQLNKDLVIAQTHRMDAETRFKQVSQGKPIPQVLNNQLIQTLKGQDAKFIAEQSELSKKYGEDHPRMIRLKTEAATIRSKIAAETDQVVQSIKNEYHMAQAQEENLQKALEAQKADTQDFSDRNVHYRVLLRDVETNRALYENILKSLKTTTTAENIPATNIRVVYPATIPELPVSPRKLRNLMLGAVMGIFFGVGAAFGLENLDTTLKTPEEVENWLEISNLGMIPHLDFSAANPGQESESKPEFIVHHGTQPLASEAYLGLRTSILFSSPGQAPEVLLITSSLPKEGKTLTAVNLACAMAKAGSTILLVDSDLRRPSLHSLFAIPQEPGLSNFLVGEVKEIPAISTMVPNLFVVPSGHIPPNPSELLGSDAMGNFLGLAKERFGRVLLDSPPLMSVTDPSILAAQAKGVLFIIKAETVPRKVALEARNQLLEVNAHILGAMLNDVPIHQNGYYHNYYYRRYKYYGTEDGEPSQKRRASDKKGAGSGFFGWLKG